MKIVCCPHPLLQYILYCINTKAVQFPITVSPPGAFTFLFSPLASCLAILYHPHIQSPQSKARCFLLMTDNSDTGVQRLCFQPQQCLKPLPAKQNTKTSLLLLYVPLPVSPPPPPPLLLLSESWFHLTWQELWKLCRHPKHGSKRTSRQLLDAAWEIGDDALPLHRLFNFSLYLSFQLHRQTALCLPCSAGLLLLVARENVLMVKEGELDAEGKNFWFNWCREK